MLYAALSLFRNFSMTSSEDWGHLTIYYLQTLLCGCSYFIHQPIPFTTCFPPKPIFLVSVISRVKNPCFFVFPSGGTTWNLYKHTLIIFWVVVWPCQWLFQITLLKESDNFDANVNWLSFDKLFWETELLAFLCIRLNYFHFFFISSLIFRTLNLKTLKLSPLMYGVFSF